MLTANGLKPVCSTRIRRMKPMTAVISHPLQPSRLKRRRQCRHPSTHPHTQSRSSRSSTAAISVTELPEPVRVAHAAPVEAAPSQARHADAEGFVVSHAAQEVHAAQETSATVAEAEAPATDIFEKPVSRPIENPFGPAPKVAEEKVESPFADTPKAAEPEPVITHAQPEVHVAEPVETAPVAAMPVSETVASITSPAACRGGGVYAGRTRAGEDV